MPEPLAGKITFSHVEDRSCRANWQRNASERMKRKPKLALRVNHENPNHHLWNNRGVWWCHLTVHKPDATAERLRFSLKTRDVEQARERRDRIFRQIAEHYEIAA